MVEAPQSMEVVVGVEGFAFDVLEVVEVVVAAAIGGDNADREGEAAAGTVAVREVAVATSDLWGKWKG